MEPMEYHNKKSKAKFPKVGNYNEWNRSSSKWL